jgi:hypothetical protein
MDSSLLPPLQPRRRFFVAELCASVTSRHALSLPPSLPPYLPPFLLDLFRYPAGESPPHRPPSPLISYSSRANRAD